MGCLKLTYYPVLDLVKNEHKKGVTSNKSALNERSAYLYGFNGMEKDDEVKGGGNSYDFGARMYDSRLGRWLSNDPLAVKYPFMSPYAGIGNNPIAFVDPDGKEVRIYGDIEKFIALMNYLFEGKITVEVSNINNQHLEEASDPSKYPTGMKGVPNKGTQGGGVFSVSQSANSKWNKNEALRRNFWRETYSTINLKISEEDIQMLTREQLAIYDELMAQISSEEINKYISFEKGSNIDITGSRLQKMDDLFKYISYYKIGVKKSGNEFQSVIDADDFVNFDTDVTGGLSSQQMFLLGITKEDKALLNEVSKIKIESWDSLEGFSFKDRKTGEIKKSKYKFGKFKTKRKTKNNGGKHKNPRFL